MLPEPDMRLPQSEQASYARFLLTLIAALTIMLLVNYWLSHDPDHYFNPRSMWFNRGYLIMVSIPVLILAWKDKQPPSRFGLRLEGFQKAFREGIFLTLLLLPCLFLIRMMIIRDQGLSISVLANYFISKPIDFAYTYGTSVMMQQCVRSFLQENLMTIFAASHPALPILVSSLLFGLMHLHFGLYAVLITFLVGLFFSLVYLRHKNIFGLIIPHTTLGIVAFMTGLL